MNSKRILMIDVTAKMSSDECTKILCSAPSTTAFLILLGTEEFHRTNLKIVCFPSFIIRCFLPFKALSQITYARAPPPKKPIAIPITISIQFIIYFIYTNILNMNSIFIHIRNFNNFEP